MRSALIRCLLCLSVLFAAGAASAVGTDFTWQGELREGGLPATGSYDFEFRLFAAASGGSPIGPVRSLPAQTVIGGIYTAVLDFGDQFTGDRRWLEVSVRRSGQPTFTTLLPRQALTATPYAQHADFVADNSIVGANIVDGAVGVADIDAAQVQRRVAATCAPGSSIRSIAQDGGVTCETDDGGAGTVTSVVAGSGLNGGTITTSGTLSVNTATIQARVTGECPTGQFIRQIQQSGQVACESVSAAGGTVTVVNTGAGLSGGPITTTGTVSIAEGGVTGAMIAAGAVGAAKVDASQVQLRIVGNCATGDYLAGINADGSVLCSPLPIRFRRDLETANDVGEYAAVAVRNDGRPIIAYYDRTNDDLRLYDCTTSSCAGGSARVLDAGSSLDRQVAIAIRANGLPIVAYASIQGLRVYDCGNTSCSSGTARTLDPGPGIGLGASIAMRANGRPLIGYIAFTGGEIRAYDCADSACSGGTVRVIDDAVSVSLNAGQRTAVAVASSGQAWIAYQDATLGDARIARCVNDACDTSPTLITLDAANNVGAWIAMDLTPAGAPVVTYHDATDTALKLAICGPNCASVTLRTLDNAGSSDVGTHTAVAVPADGRPVIAYHDVAGGDLKFFVCDSATCGNGTTRVLADGSSALPVGHYASLALRPDDRPVIAFHDEGNDDLEFHLCAGPTCD